ncbi:hypothetical protein NG799_02395 [Laspinema sp. D1]|uniref:Phycobilisome protein n=1 Tax=Laspinema palackyanum D2a TaxID=2953684 RepID=A0ABT2MKE1_9CYAN|nr:hypothetical protein [Laspinema sp. D2a]
MKHQIRRMEQQIRQESLRGILKGMPQYGWLLESQVRTHIFRDDLSGYVEDFLNSARSSADINFLQLIQFKNSRYPSVGDDHAMVVEFLKSCMKIYEKTIFSEEELEDIFLMITEYLESGAGYNALHEG